MENQDIQDIQNEDWKKITKAERRGKIMGGLLVVAIGSLFLAKELGAELPVWLFTWKMLLISIGIVIAVKHRFMHPGWIILIGIGGAFLLNDLYPDMHIKPFLWPVLIILLGLFMIFKPRRRHYPHWRKRHAEFHKFSRGRHQHRHHRDFFANENTPTENPTDEDYLVSVSFMGGTKKNVLTKTFKGGDIVNVFGGTFLNLSQADMEEKATLSITQVFGGTKLIVPANWEIKSESVTICGAIEDKRAVQANVAGETNKVLILVGTTVFGGIEIRSHE